MKAKEYAASLGLAKPGKGRMSREAHEAIQKAIADGMTFSDYGVTKGAAPRGPVVQKDSPIADGPKDEVVNVYADAFMRYSLDQEFTYVDDENKRRTVSARVACMECGYSLAGHTCNSPVVLTKYGPRAVVPKGE